MYSFFFGPENNKLGQIQACFCTTKIWYSIEAPLHTNANDGRIQAFAFWILPTGTNMAASRCKHPVVPTADIICVLLTFSVFCFCFYLFIVLCIFIFVCTSVGMLPPDESPIAVSSSSSSTSSSILHPLAAATTACNSETTKETGNTKSSIRLLFLMWLNYAASHRI